MQASNYVFDLCRYWEARKGPKLYAYADPFSPRGRALQLPILERPQGWEKLPGIPWTIGYGHTKNVHEGQTCTFGEAEAMLLSDIQDAENSAAPLLVDVALNQFQFDAIVCFVFCFGAEKFKTSTLLKMLKAGDMAGAAKEFLRWDHDGLGNVIPGLLERRKMEMALFLGQPTYIPRSI